jgi:hypothetical protein
MMLSEIAADRLASFWLGITVDTTSGREGERRRHYLRHELSAAYARFKL